MFRCLIVQFRLAGGPPLEGSLHSAISLCHGLGIIRYEVKRSVLLGAAGLGLEVPDETTWTLGHTC